MERATAGKTGVSPASFPLAHYLLTRYHSFCTAHTARTRTVAFCTTCTPLFRTPPPHTFYLCTRSTPAFPGRASSAERRCNVLGMVDVRERQDNASVADLGNARLAWRAVATS